jgi:hypothetical protein
VTYSWFVQRSQPELQRPDFIQLGIVVLREGLEPPRLAALVPKTSVSTNSTIGARPAKVVGRIFSIETSI